MDIQQIQDGCTIIICNKCKGWGAVEEIQYDSTRIYKTCTTCNGSGRLVEKTTSRKFKLVIDMNSDFSEMPFDVVVQVKINIRSTNTDVWSLASKSKNGEIDVRGFKPSEYDLIGWRIL